MTTPDTAAVRAWARENGYEISDRGRLPAEVTEAYAAAHPSGKAAAGKGAATKAPAKKSAATKAPAKKAPAKKAPAKRSAAKKAPAATSETAPAETAAAETADDAAPTTQPPGSAPLTDPDKQQSGAPEDRRLIALAEQIAALTDRVAGLEKAQSGGNGGKAGRFGRRKSR